MRRFIALTVVIFTSIAHAADIAPLIAQIKAVGPEGGFTVEEVEAARQVGFEPVGLGPRILRTETAALVALAILGYALGDLG